MAFILDPRLQAETIPIAAWPLCQLLLKNDKTFPWLILVPQRADTQEIYQLTSLDRSQLMEEINSISNIMMELFKPDKLNIAALGNIVPQLHVHVIARYQQDAAWPNPAWGKPALPYDADELTNLISRLQEYACL